MITEELRTLPHSEGETFHPRLSLVWFDLSDAMIESGRVLSLWTISAVGSWTLAAESASQTPGIIIRGLRPRSRPRRRRRSMASQHRLSPSDLEPSWSSPSRIWREARASSRRRWRRIRRVRNSPEWLYRPSKDWPQSLAPVACLQAFPPGPYSQNGVRRGGSRRPAPAVTLLAFRLTHERRLTCLAH